MLIPEILTLAGLAMLFRIAGSGAAQRWLVFAASVLCVYWLQPAMTIRNLDFWLPTATLALTVLAWLVTAPPSERAGRANWQAGAVLAGLVLLVGLTRFLGPGDWLIPTRPPAIEQVLVTLVLVTGLVVVAGILLRRLPGTPARLLAAGVVVLVLGLVVLKAPPLAVEAARGLRALAGQNPGLATAFDIRWLGISYVAFRLIHTLRDRQTGRLPAVDLLTYVSYVVFFPSFVAGPIDRLERFAKDFCAAPGTAPGTGPQVAAQPAAGMGIVARPAPLALLADERFSADLTEAARRIAIGMFKKFALADSLALVALNPTNAGQVMDAGWLWLLVYLYAFQILLDFSGYTDIAIGLGLILGVKLPENFAAPYLKPNLTQFWSSWHMSLTLWFRAYFFNPFVRWLRGLRKGQSGPRAAEAEKSVPPPAAVSPVFVLFLSQVCTMLLIGLWHGITINFVVWGLWHGWGLFVQNRWTELVRPWFAARNFSPPASRGLHILSVLLTFHYVALGWVWFVLPLPEMAAQVTAHLFGVGW
jgi:alginate O-acetyltransferase complex protein AlgI